MFKALCQHDGSGKCQQCGEILPERLRRQCSAWQRIEPKQGVAHPGLGDRTERLLQSIGITEDGYKAAKEKFGLPPTCRCKAVKAWLNDVSDWWRSRGAN